MFYSGGGGECFPSWEKVQNDSFSRQKTEIPKATLRTPSETEMHVLRA